jgi:hypothetical protein
MPRRSDEIRKALGANQPVPVWTQSLRKPGRLMQDQTSRISARLGALPISAELAPRLGGMAVKRQLTQYNDGDG